MKQGFVYIMTSANNTTFYTGTTSNLLKRIYDHKYNKGSVFTAKYKLHKLVYYETCESMIEAIIREKQIKDMNRDDKVVMIKRRNPLMKDLYEDVAKGNA